MDFSRQAPRAAEMHSKYLLTGQATCIDCHKGIAHELPDMTGVDPGWTMPVEDQPPPAEPQQGASADDQAALRRYLDG